MRHVLSALVRTFRGALAHFRDARLARLQHQSLAVGETEDPRLSRMTFVVVGDNAVLEQVRKQLAKIVTVVRVDNVSSQDHVERDLMLIKVDAPLGKRATSSSWSACFAAGSSTFPPTCDDRDFRARGQNRVVYRAHAAFQDHRVGPHRPDRHGPRVEPLRRQFLKPETGGPP